MTPPPLILDAMPEAAEFYAAYWGARPFVARGVVPASVMETLIGADELAGLSLADAAESRIVQSGGASADWSCRFGPFDDDVFEGLGEADWSLLVRHVEQFHPATAALLPYFGFSPRWLMDDIMVSYAVPGGSVGPHLDSYHVFLVQGQGRRRWKLGSSPMENEVYMEGLDLKILQGGLEGDVVEVTCGDVIYVPPKFAHEGEALENSLTFSVGFLGPKLSELYMGYGQYLADREGIDQRYLADGLSDLSKGFKISADPIENIKQSITDGVKIEAFHEWLAEFFSGSSHEDFGNFEERVPTLSPDALVRYFGDGGGLIKPLQVKLAVVSPGQGGCILGLGDHAISVDESLAPLLNLILDEEILNSGSIGGLMDNHQCVDLLLELYNLQALEFYQP